MDYVIIAINSILCLGNYANFEMGAKISGYDGECDQACTRH
jgi:hypothetical protein